jgi:hypothetical protein
MESTSSNDRRHEPRAKLNLFVNRFLNGHPYMCRMTDISRTGARIVPIIEPRVSPIPSHMGLQFQLPGRDEVVTASGVAVVDAPAAAAGPGQASGRAVGIRFTNLSADSVSAIDAFMNAG